MLTTGESTWRMPRLAVSPAMAFGDARHQRSCPTSPRARWPAGNIVAPSRVRPCTASSNGMIGMPSRVLLDEVLLNRVDALGVRARGGRRRRRRRVLRRADLQAEDAVRVVVGGRVEIARDHEQLPELLLERHAREQVAHARVDRQAWPADTGADAGPAAAMPQSARADRGPATRAWTELTVRASSW